MSHVRKININGYDYLFNEVECNKIEKYFDSIRLFMDDVIVDKIIYDFYYDIYYGDDEFDVIKLVAYYDYYLLENDYEKECDFSQIMYFEFGVDI